MLPGDKEKRRRRRQKRAHLHSTHSTAEEEPKSFCSDSDNLEAIKNVILLLAQFGQVVLATLLGIFVPQKCSGPPEGLCAPLPLPVDTSTVQYDATGCAFQPNAMTDVFHQCSVTENFNEAEDYKLFVVIFNFFTLAMFIVQYLLIVDRETKMIDVLDHDPQEPLDGLKERLSAPQYKHIRDDLETVHRRVFITSVITTVVFVTNAVVSAILVFRPSRILPPSPTVVAYLTNIALVAGAVYKQLLYSYTGRQDETALSLIEILPLNFNVIDKDYVRHVVHDEEDPVRRRSPGRRHRGGRGRGEGSPESGSQDAGSAGDEQKQQQQEEVALADLQALSVVG